MSAVAYFHLDHEAYKNLERQMKEFRETTHTATPGPFYHKSIRLRITPELIIEFHGPNVRGGEMESSISTNPLPPIAPMKGY